MDEPRPGLVEVRFNLTEREYGRLEKMAKIAGLRSVNELLADHSKHLARYA